MKKLSDIYDALRMHGLCKNQSDFSMNWLGRSRCYLSYLNSTGAIPSLVSLGLLVKTLEPEVELARHRGDQAIYRPLRSALVEAKMLYNYVYEIKYVPPLYWVTAI